MSTGSTGAGETHLAKAAGKHVSGLYQQHLPWPPAVDPWARTSQEGRSVPWPRCRNTILGPWLDDFTSDVLPARPHLSCIQTSTREAAGGRVGMDQEPATQRLPQEAA